MKSFRSYIIGFVMGAFGAWLYTIALARIGYDEYDVKLEKK